VLSPRLGFLTAVSVIAIGWVFFTTMILVVTPSTPIHFTAVVACAWVLAAAMAWRTERSWKILSPHTAEAGRPGLVGSLAGALVWLISAGLGQLLPSGSGLSWAAYADSSLDVWALRDALQYNGMRSIGGNPRPVEHALTASLSSPLQPLGAQASTFANDVATHGVNWVVLVALACLLAGGVAATVMSRLQTSPILVTTGSAFASLGLLAAPVTGIVFKRGQINAHVTWVIVFAVVIIALSRRVSPMPRLALLVAAMTAAMLCWTPFAAIPGVLLAAYAWHYRQLLRSAPALAAKWMVLPCFAFVWSFIFFDYTGFFLRLGGDGEAANRAVTARAIYANPAWIPLTATILLGTVLTSFLLARIDRRVGLVGTASAAAALVGMVPFLTSRGGWEGPLEYYPARYVSMAAVAIAPLLIGLTLGALRGGGVTVKSVAAGVAVAVVTLGAAAPSSDLVSKTGYTPVYLLTGDYFGTRAEMIDKINTYGSPDVFNVAWNADPPYDFWVNYMLGVNEPGSRLYWSTPLRIALRNYGVDTSLERLCEIGGSSERPVVAHTRDASLVNELASTCPESAVAVVRLND